MRIYAIFLFFLIVPTLCFCSYEPATFVSPENVTKNESPVHNWYSNIGQYATKVSHYLGALQTRYNASVRTYGSKIGNAFLAQIQEWVMSPKGVQLALDRIVLHIKEPYYIAGVSFIIIMGYYFHNRVINTKKVWIYPVLTRKKNKSTAYHWHAERFNLVHELQ